MARPLALLAALALAALSVACASSAPPSASPHHANNCDRYPAGSANCFAVEHPVDSPEPVVDHGIASTRHAPVHETQVRSTISTPRTVAPSAPRPTPPPRPR